MSAPATIMNGKLAQVDTKRLQEIIQVLSKEKKNTVLVVVDCVDALGDFKHFKEFFLKLKRSYPLLNVAGIIGAWGSNAPICNKIMAFLKTPEGQSSAIWVSIDCEATCKDMSFKDLKKSDQESIIQNLINPYRDSKNFLKKLDESVACVIHVSTSLEFNADKNILTWLSIYQVSNASAYFYFPEYGKKGGTHNMGLGLKDAGIRLREDWAGEITLERKAAVLLEITHKKFLQLLFNKEEPMEDDVKQYLHKRKLFVADLRDSVSLSQFVLTQIHAYQDTTFQLDFYVPHQSHNELTAFNPSTELDLMKISKGEYAVVDSIDTDKNLMCRFRFFTNQIALNDEDYDSLCFCASSIGYTGDDGATKAFSALSLPFGIHYTYPIKKDFRKEIIERAKSLKCNFLANYLELIEKNLLGEIAFRTDLIETAATLGSFIRDNHDHLMTDLLIFRADLYQSANVFEHLPSILMRTMPKTMLSALDKFLPPESQNNHWKYDGGKGMYWLKVADQEKYTKLVQQQDLESAVTIRKMQKEQAFCVCAPAEVVLSKLLNQ